MKLPKEVQEYCKKFENMKKYTHEELAEFKKKGIAGQVCICKIHIANSMTYLCPICNKVFPEYAKKYINRKLKED